MSGTAKRRVASCTGARGSVSEYAAVLARKHTKIIPTACIESGVSGAFGEHSPSGRVLYGFRE